MIFTGIQWSLVQTGVRALFLSNSPKFSFSPATRVRSHPRLSRPSQPYSLSPSTPLARPPSLNTTTHNGAPIDVHRSDLRLRYSVFASSRSFSGRSRSPGIPMRRRTHTARSGILAASNNSRAIRHSIDRCLESFLLSTLNTQISRANKLIASIVYTRRIDELHLPPAGKDATTL
jgi:hypothetical protein